MTARPRFLSDVSSEPRRRRLVEVETSWLPAGVLASAVPRLRVGLESVDGGRRRCTLTCDRRMRTRVSVDTRALAAVAAFALVGSASAFRPFANLALRVPARPLAGPSAASPIPCYPAPAPDVARLYGAARYLRTPSSSGALAAAVDFAARAHDDQRRRSGEPYIVHPLHVATVLAELRMDSDTVIAGLLHDVVEDTDTTLGEIEAAFGAGVASIVSGVTDEAGRPDPENQEELLLSMSSEWRVALVKLADRLHNMRTLRHMPRPKQLAKARETMALYVPLAERLSIAPLADELLALSAATLTPSPLYRFAPRKLAATVARLNVPDTLAATLKQLDIDLDAAAGSWKTHAALNAAEPLVLSPCTSVEC